ncbi:MAG: DUF4406 domain-containing protein [Bacteroidales bacterium]|nr:DUF4406 domain-containing protein [Bacteroidales bacterium]
MYRIFISGPYTKGDIALNVKRAMDLANELINLGFAPYFPHLTHFLHMNNWQPYEKWLELDCEYLILCDGVIRIQGESAGADNEVQLAKKKNITVFFSLNEVVDFFSTKD